jgi:farnesyl diphosphate synthase
MDDDDLRRGRLTTHKAFDEATAVLTGDALLTIAFEILVDAETHRSAEVRCKLIARLAQAAGSNGMIGGQMIDMQAPERTFGAEEIVLLQRLKTGQLFEFSCEAGPILGEAGDADRERLRLYARDMGLVFQITDDLLDVTGTAEKTGKTVGKDKDQGKATLVSIHGVDGARAEAEKLARRAADTLAPYGKAADPLRELPGFLLGRDA